MLVWGGIMLNEQRDPFIFDRGSLIGKNYCNKIILVHVRPSRSIIGSEFFLW